MGNKDNKKIAVNSIIIFARLCVRTLIGLIASRMVLDALGASDYGLYNVVGGIVVFLNIINSAMLSTTYRYIAFEVGKGAEGNPNSVFNASFVIHICFGLLLLIFGMLIGDWYVNNYLNVEPGKLDDALFVLHISLLTTAISTFHVPFQGLLVAYEKFAVNAVIDILTNVLNLTLLFAFIYTDGNRLRTYSLLMMTCTVFSATLYILYCAKKYWTVVKFKISHDIEMYKSMFSYAFWTLLGAVAIIGKTQGSKVLINFFFGTVVNAAYAIGCQIENMIQTFARSLSQSAIPQITKNFSGGNSKRSVKLTCYISKYTFLLMSIVAYPAFLEIDFLLNLWLKEVPEGTVVFCKLIMLNGLLGCLGEGIPALVNATGNIRTYQIVYQTCNFLGLPIAYICFKLGYNQYSIMVVYCIVTFLIAFVRLYLLKRIFNFDVAQFVNISYLKILYVSVPLVIAYILYDSSNFPVWGHVLGLGGAVAFLFMVIYLFGLDKEERKIIGGFLGKYVKRHNI
jgi:O-antigen/teichoic acid export membrane protein